ncbi:hypothetical protein CRE_07714 [Caenorhabditis remanei]|uniref:Uncharacterized protein n=1 Tax=Caenorhabditis remanei TaxID=31234 RepID=E3MZS8_CAERE|nr:hypothetical protein CRE_07714 [Caenorhabditis remanei]
MLLTTILVVVGLCVGGAENWKMENCPVTSKPVTEKPITEEPVTEEPANRISVMLEILECCSSISEYENCGRLLDNEAVNDAPIFRLLVRTLAVIRDFPRDSYHRLLEISYQKRRRFVSTMRHFETRTRQLSILPECCQYPIRTTTINNANVTAPNFKCVEPIAMKCQITNSLGGLVNNIGIAGSSDRYISAIVSFSTRSIHLTYHFQLIVSKDIIEKTLICSPSSAMWHLEGVPEDEFSSFTCAYMFSNGTWLIQ